MLHELVICIFVLLCILVKVPQSMHDEQIDTSVDDIETESSKESFVTRGISTSAHEICHHVCKVAGSNQMKNLEYHEH